MTAQARRQRDHAERERLIIAAARELAESDGWEGVTTRRLAERVEYSQPVLYTHFAGKDAIMAAVALQGFAELADELRTRSGLAAVAAAYLDFAERSPALYDAMFSRAVDLPFATDETPPALRDGFDQLRRVVGAGEAGDDVLTEVLWSALHGLVTLTRGRRLPRELQEQRLARLVEMFTR
ncbi:TetR/AcrR family transcriptional regulator [Paractinoplanes ferrugineus]|uniref:TetR family transcriptional regulator n=1 Tax=Paractinoplanes ferrugineus TaxID=113564 RepID=A0A919J1D3_9ACTN|nr:TetR/AcrR family transcriptional regulator [Actinoplanes ferrugineus]GIE12655.1 TetR family transcriptional regulator [Actinoplanes ferrugineus]